MRGEDQENSGPTWSKLCTLLKNRSKTTRFVCEEKGGKVCTLHRNLFHLLNDLALMVSSQIIKTSKTDRREGVKLKGTDGEKHLQATNSDDEEPRAQYWYKVPRQTESEMLDRSTNCASQEHSMTVPPLLKQKRSTMSADESRLQLNGALEEHVLVS